jgi:hypothetical protein
MPAWRARMLGPGRAEVSCEQCFAVLDRYVELELTDTDAEGRFPGMEAHLEGCPACREEHDLLLEYAREQELR